ncbi:MAG: hypothetical protein KF765_12300 [Parvibaculaceae bacterium]|nr:hypothetical protein [Parvibaculaceae bacterium]
MEPAWIIAGVALASFALSLATFAYTWHSNKNRAQRGEIDAVYARLNEESGRRRDQAGELRDRMTRVETEMQHLPSAVAVAAMNGELASLATTMKGMDVRMERIEAYLMQEGKRK